jgi:undecaprenyl-diphosphatase
VGLSIKTVLEALFRFFSLQDYTQIEDLFKSLPLISLALFCGGILILLSSKKAPQNQELTLKKALCIGAVQGLCLPFRGFSRSGATISTALLLGMSYSQAEAFSFALALAVTPPVLLRACYKLLKSAPQFTLLGFSNGLIGGLISFFTGIIALKLLSSISAKGNWKAFGIYSLISSLVFCFLAFYLGY